MVARTKEISELGEVVWKTWWKTSSTFRLKEIPSYKCTENGVRRSNDEAFADVGGRSTSNRLGTTRGTALEVVG